MPREISVAMSLRQFGLLVALAIVAIGSPAMAVEEPSFQTVMHDGAFEVRDYPRLIVAEVTVSGEQKEAASKGFRLLAGYIFGGNNGRQTIAMTAPVAQQPVSEKIAMTAPVTQTKVADSWVVRFTMPSAFTTIEMLPEPNDPRVTLRSLPATRVAVLRFSGLARRSEVEAKDAELLDAVRSHHLQPIGPVTLAQYNPPWTPWFMRRNEVMVALSPG